MCVNSITACRLHRRQLTNFTRSYNGCRERFVRMCGCGIVACPSNSLAHEPHKVTFVWLDICYCVELLILKHWLHPRRTKFLCLFVCLTVFLKIKKITGLSWVFRHLWCLFCNLCCLNVPVKMMNRISSTGTDLLRLKLFWSCLLKNCIAHWNKIIACLHISHSWSVIIA